MEATLNEKAATLLSVNNIEVVYDHVILVLKGVSLEVPEGGIVALLGANGAGKTTTLKSISNLLMAERGDITKGTIEFRGESIQGLSANQLVKRGVIQVMDLPKIYSTVSSLIRRILNSLPQQAGMNMIYLKVIG